MSNAAILNSKVNILDPEFDGAHQLGNKSRVPYIRLFSKLKSPRTAIGWYRVILFNEIGECVYLKLGHGNTDLNADDRHIRSEREMQELATWE